MEGVTLDRDVLGRPADAGDADAVPDGRDVRPAAGPRRGRRGDPRRRVGQLDRTFRELTTPAWPGQRSQARRSGRPARAGPGRTTAGHVAGRVVAGVRRAAEARARQPVADEGPVVARPVVLGPDRRRRRAGRPRRGSRWCGSTAGGVGRADRHDAPRRRRGRARPCRASDAALGGRQRRDVGAGAVVVVVVGLAPRLLGAEGDERDRQPGTSLGGRRRRPPAGRRRRTRCPPRPAPAGRCRGARPPRAVERRRARRAGSRSRWSTGRRRPGSPTRCRPARRRSGVARRTPAHAARERSTGRLPVRRAGAVPRPDLTREVPHRPHRDGRVDVVRRRSWAAAQARPRAGSRSPASGWPSR